MQRRHFLQAAALAGLGLVAPRTVKRAQAASGGYEGPYWVFVHAGGGWDPTSLCDPKGGVPEDRRTVNMNYTPESIGSAGAIRYAPLSYTVPNEAGAVEVYSNRRFFESHGGRFTVLNGVDTATNNHDTGTRTVWSGKPEEGMPAFAALVAANASRELSLPVPFLSYGGYDATMSVVPITRAANADVIRRLAYPQRLDPSRADSPTYHSADTSARIAAAQRERLIAMKDRGLPAAQKAMNALYLAREADTGLGRLSDALSSQPLISLDKVLDIAPVRNALGGLEGLMRQAQLSVLAFQAGVAVSANLSLGGFDTHDNHDNNHTRSLMLLLRGLDYLFASAEQAGILDKLYVIVGSDFGRTPHYNERNGKDHWNVTSMLLSGPGIAGGRVIGGTDGGYRPLRVDSATLELAPDATESTPGTQRITTAAIHRSLRALAGIDEELAVKQYPLANESLPLFG